MLFPFTNDKDFCDRAVGFRRSAFQSIRGNTTIVGQTFFRSEGSIGNIGCTVQTRSLLSIDTGLPLIGNGTSIGD